MSNEYRGVRTVRSLEHVGTQGSDEDSGSPRLWFCPVSGRGQGHILITYVKALCIIIWTVIHSSVSTVITRNHANKTLCLGIALCLRSTMCSLPCLCISLYCHLSYIVVSFFPFHGDISSLRCHMWLVHGGLYVYCLQPQTRVLAPPPVAVPGDMCFHGSVTDDLICSHCTDWDSAIETLIC